MTREQLLAQGLTEEQANAVMALHGQTVQGLNATINQHNTTITRLNGELEQARNANPNPEPPNPELAEAQKQIADLRSEMNKKDIQVYASSKGLSGEQAKNILDAFGDNVELANAAIDSIAQIISDTDKAARDDEKKNLLKETPNPDGRDDNPDNKPDDVKNAESITFGGLAENAQTARDYYK